MRKSSKIAFGMAIILIAFGGVLFIAGFILGSSVFLKWKDEMADAAADIKQERQLDSSRNYTKSGKTKISAFESLDVSIYNGDIIIEEGDDFYIEYYLDTTQSNVTYDITGGTLIFKETAQLFGGNYILNSDQDMKETYLKITVPDNQNFQKMNIKTNLGDLSLANLNAVDFILESSYGDGSFRNISGSTLEVRASGGNLGLKELAFQTMNIINSYGDINIEAIICDDIMVVANAGDINIKDGDIQSMELLASYGDVLLKDIERIDEQGGQGAVFISLSSGNLEMTDIEGKSLSVTNSYGSVTGTDLEFSEMDIYMSSGNCYIKDYEVKQLTIENNYGNVEVDLEDDNVDLELATSYGLIHVNGDDMGMSYQQKNNNDNSVKINCSSGNIRVNTK